MQLRDLYCIRFGCEIAEFESNLIHRYMSRRARAIMPLIRLFTPGYFLEEELFAQCLGRQNDRDGVLLEVNLYHAKCVESSFPRKWLGLRLHCRQLIQHSLEMIVASEEQLAAEVLACGTLSQHAAGRAQGG